MFAIVFALLGALEDALRPRASLVVENLVLRQQLAMLKRARRRPTLRPIDRAFWVVVSRVWSRWADALAIAKPATVIGWHRRGFARFWAWKFVIMRVGRHLARDVLELTPKAWKQKLQDLDAARTQSTAA